VTDDSYYLPGFYMSKKLSNGAFESTENFEEKFSQFAKKLDSEVDKTYDTISKHCSSTTANNKESIDSSIVKIPGCKVRTIPMDFDSYENIDAVGSKISTSQCAQCGKILHDKFSLKKHEQIVHMKVKNFKCFHCVKKFGRKVDLIDHVRTVHEKLKQFICDLCGLALASRQTLKTHRLTHDASSKNIVCGICNKSFRHKNTFRKHTRRVHEFDPSKALNCQICSKSFKHSEGLKRHVKKIHDTQCDKFVCSKCPKTFAFKYDLTKHNKTHNNPLKSKKSCFPNKDGNVSQPDALYIMKDLEGNSIGFDIAVMPTLNSILGQ